MNPNIRYVTQYRRKSNVFYFLREIQPTHTTVNEIECLDKYYHNVMRKVRGHGVTNRKRDRKGEKEREEGRKKGRHGRRKEGSGWGEERGRKKKREEKQEGENLLKV